MSDLQVRFLDDISAPIHRFTYVSPEGTELGPIVCDTTKFKGWDEIRWLRFPEEERALLQAGKTLEARKLLMGLLKDWVTAQNPEWTEQRLLELLSIPECYHLAAFFGGGRLLGAFLKAKAMQETPAARPTPKTAASRSPRKRRVA